MQDMNESQYQEGYTPPVEMAQQKIEPETGPLQRAGNWLKNAFSSDQEARGRDRERTTAHTSSYGAPRERNHMAEMRDKIADFDEDYKDIGERLLGFFMQLVGYVGPFAMVLWIGTDLGAFFAPTMGGFAFYGLAYTFECIIAGETIAMGRAFAEITNGKAAWGKTALVVGVWLVLNVSSAFAIYMVITHYGNVQAGAVQLTMVVRVTAIALCDFGCSVILMFKGKSLEKHIEAMRKRAYAIGKNADVEREIEEAKRRADMRDEEARAAAAFQNEIAKANLAMFNMVVDSAHSRVQKSLSDEDSGKKSGRGGSERGYSNKY